MSCFRAPASVPSLAILTVLVAAPSPLVAQLPEDPALQEAFLAWDRGDYPEALRGYLEVLRSPGGETHVREVAALTGEVFRVTEVAPDGRGLAMGPAGRYASYEVEVDGEVVTRVLDLERDGVVVATLRGSGAALVPGGRVAYARRGAAGPEMEEAAAAMDRARAAGDRTAFFEALRRLQWLQARSRSLHVRDLASGQDRKLELGGWIPGSIVAGRAPGELWVVAGREGEPTRNDVLRIGPDGLEALDTGPGFKAGPIPLPDGAGLVVEVPPSRPVPTEPGAAPGQGERTGVALLDAGGAEVAFWAGAEEPALSADGGLLAFLSTTAEGRNTVSAVHLEGGRPATGSPTVLVATEMELDNPAVSPAGTRVAYQKRLVHDWEVFVVGTGKSAATGRDSDTREIQLSREIQHDLFPRFLDEETVLAVKGEGRHRRAFLYEVREGVDNATRLHHNNTLRTIAPEYDWVASPDGSKVLLVSERDGDTVSPERGVYLVHLDRAVTLDDVVARLERNLAAEEDLRARGREAFRPIADEVRRLTERVDVGRIYQYAKVLYSFGSKYITEPGNRMAWEYLAETLRSWGYEPELQWFEPRPGLRTANVVVRIPGTVDPDLVYVASSHYDSTRRGPGADDDSSGTTALMEVARVLADHPLPATVELAFFTGEEAGLLGSREYVRRAQVSGKHIVGALNNDMVGWANGHRLDNTIRYSNPGIRDIQHGAAVQFSDLILYDALYYKSTDAHAYYEAYGDIVGGIGSYPVLGSPHYHQFTDRLNTIDQRLVTEVARVTVATLMKLASSPSRVAGLTLGDAGGDGLRVSWHALPESDVDHYVVRWTEVGGDVATRRIPASAAREVMLEDVRPGSEVAVRGVNAAGLAGWDWARAELKGLARSGGSR